MYINNLILKKIKIELPYDIEIPLVAIYPKKKKLNAESLRPISSTTHKSQEGEVTQMSIDG